MFSNSISILRVLYHLFSSVNRFRIERMNANNPTASERRWQWQYLEGGNGHSTGSI
jgi:hypothetical protein